MVDMIFMLAIVTGVFAFGDICGVATKARLSSVFVALLSMLILFMAKVIPPDIVQRAGLSDIAKWSSPILVFSMGTMIDVKQLIREWRTVALSLISMLVTLLSVLAVSPFISKETAIVSIPILNGGIIATQIMTEGALASGFQMAAAIGTLTYAVQKFVGTIPASFFGLREARLLVNEFRKHGKLETTESQKETNTPAKQTFAEKYKTYFTPFVCFALAALGGLFAVCLQKATGVHNSVIALILGAAIGWKNLVPKNILEHGKSSGLITMIVFAAIIPSLAKVQLSDLLAMGFSLIIIFAAVIIGVYIFIYILPTWKLVGSKNLAVGVAMGQLLGFPATYLIANEISRAVSETDEEYEAVMSRIAPAYVVSGMSTVTTLSIIIAGIMVQYL